MKLFHVVLICEYFSTKIASLSLQLFFFSICLVALGLTSVSCSRKGGVKKLNIDSENAGNIDVQNYFQNCSFDSIAIWGTPLPNKGGLTFGN